MALTTVGIAFRAAGVLVGVAELTMVAAIVLLLPLLATIELPRSYILAVLLYFTWMVATLLWTDDLLNATSIILQYVLYLLAAPLLFAAISSIQSLVKCLRIYVAASSILAILVIIYAVANGSFTYIYFYNYNKNYLGSIVGNAIPLLVALMLLPNSRPWLLRLILALNVMVLFMSSSRGAAIGAVVGIAVVLLLTGRLRRSIEMLIVGAALWIWFTTSIAPDYYGSLTDVSDNSSAYFRVLLFGHAIEMINDNFLFGSGIGSYLYYLPTGKPFADPNNLVLLTMVEFGLLGSLLLAAIIAIVIRKCVTNAKLFRGDRIYSSVSAALAGAFISQLVHIQFDISWIRGTSTFMFACAGMLFALPRLYATSLGASISSDQATSAR